MNRKPVAIVGLIIVVATLLFATPASAHRSGCHRWHSCASDSGSYTCGDLGYSTFCGGNATTTISQPPTTTASDRLQSNPPPKWDGYANWPFTPTVIKDDPLLSLVNFSHRVYEPSTGSEDVRTLSLQIPKTTVLASMVTAYDFASNSTNHVTRVIERKNSYGTQRRVIGRFVNTTKGPIRFGNVSVFTNPGLGHLPRKVTTTYLNPSTLLAGQEAYYDITVYGLDSINDLAVGVTDWIDPVTLPQVHRFPVSEVKWQTEGQYLPSLKVTATVLNDTPESASIINVLFVLKDKSGLPIKVQSWYVFALSAGQTAQVSTTVFSDFEGLASVDVLAYTD